MILIFVLIVAIALSIVRLCCYESLTFEQNLYDTGFLSYTWIGVTHYILCFDAVQDSFWLYHDYNSNIEFNLGKTIVFETKKELNQWFDPDKLDTNSVFKQGVSKNALKRARQQKFDSIQILRHRDPILLQEPKFEIIDLQCFNSMRALQRYRNKRSKKWIPFGKPVWSSAWGPNLKLSSF